MLKNKQKRSLTRAARNRGCASVITLLIAVVAGAQRPPVPPIQPLVVPQRIGIFGTASLSLGEVIARVLANDKDLVVSRIAREEAIYNISGARGYYDPRLVLNAYRVRSVTPISSLIGGAANGKLTQKQLYADPQLSGSSPWLGGTYRLDFAQSRASTDSTFVTLNPQFPQALNLNLTQPLWRGLRFDDNRHRLEVARRNLELTESQFRQRVIEIATQAIQAYWELDYANRNLAVQIEAVRLAEQQDASNRRQVAQGLLAPVDVVQTQVQVATFQGNVFQAQEDLTRAENNLKQLMLPDRGDPMWGAALVPETPLDSHQALPQLGGAVRQALAARPELVQSGVNIQINQLDARLNSELAKPQIDAQATLSLQGLAGRPIPPGPNPLTGNTQAITDRINLLSMAAGLPPIPPLNFGSGQVPAVFVGGYGQSLSNLTGGSFPTAQIGVQMSLPLRNRTARAQEAIAMSEGKRLAAQRQQLEMGIEADVRNALQTLASTRARLEAAGLARQSAEDQYSSEQRQFQAGTSSVFLVLQRQTDLINARSREVRAKADLGRAAADLDRATGSTIETRRIRITP